MGLCAVKDNDQVLAAKNAMQSVESFGLARKFPGLIVAETLRNAIRLYRQSNR
jgi:hypothetical protein